MELDDNKVFEIFALQFGQIYDAALLNQTDFLAIDYFAKEICNSAEEIPSLKKQNYKIRHAWIDYPPNYNERAKVKKIENYFFIGINRRFIDSLFIVCHRLYQHIGFKSYETDTSDKPLPSEIDHSLKTLDIDLGSKAVLRTESEDLRRSLMADLTAQNCIKILMFHEIAHVVFSHIDLSELIKSKLPLLVGVELEEAKLTLQALEIEADIFAVKNCVNSAISSPIHTINIPRIPEYQFVKNMMFKDLQTICLEVSIAACILLEFPEFTWKIESILNYNHPPSILRQIILTESLAFQACGDGHEKSQDRYDFVMRSFLGSKGMISLMSNSPLSNNYSNATLDELISHGEQLKIRCFNILKATRKN